VTDTKRATRDVSTSDVPDIDRKKFLVPADLTTGAALLVPFSWYAASPRLPLSRPVRVRDSQAH
jgi:Autophagy protein Atg8 ubiquitin like